MPESGIGERGIAIPLLAILCPVIIVFLALAFDLGLFVAEQSNRDRTAEAISLAALKAYMDERGASSTSTSADAYAKALTRANLVAQMNIADFVTTNIRHATLSTPLADLWAVKDESASDGETRLVPGRWLVDIPENAAERALCVPAAQAGMGCFHPVTKNDSANAFRLVLRTPPALALQIFFSAGILSRFHPLVNSEAYATLVPRRGIFLVDLSRSIVDDTHLASAAPSIKSEYAYPLDETLGASCSDGTIVSNPSEVSNDYRGTFSALGAGPRSSSDPATVHFQNEFRCLTVPVANEPRYAADSQTAPQPLTQVTEALHEALEYFLRRGVSDDRVGIIGFDDGPIPERILDLNSSKPTASDAAFNQFRTVYTNVSLPLQDRAGAYLFPRPLGSRSAVPYGRLPASTDLRWALNEAKTMITGSPAYMTSDNFLVLITDGFPNCPQREIIPGTSCFYSSSNAVSLALSEAYVKESLSDVTSPAFLAPFAEARIAIHLFMLGKAGGGHTLTYRQGSGCMSDNDARMSVPPLAFVNANGGTFDPTDSQPYFPATSLYQIPSLTGGEFVPVRSPCKTDGSSAVAEINAACAALSSDGSMLRNYSGCVDSSCSSNTQFVDAQGRLLCDPTGDSIGAQVRRAMNQIMSDNPYMLVHPQG